MADLIESEDREVIAGVDVGDEGSAGADDFGASFAEEDDDEGGVQRPADEAVKADAAVDEPVDEAVKADAAVDELPEDAAKALEDRIAKRAADDAIRAEESFWQSVEEGFDGDVDEVVGSSTFKTWISKQSPSVQAAASQVTDAAAALRILDDFQAAQAEFSKVDTDVDSFLDKTGLADLMVGTEGDQQTLKEFCDEYPDIGQGVLAMADQIAGQKVEAFMSEKGYLTAEQVQAMIDGQSKILALHSDAGEFIKSAAYTDWLAKQPESVRGMAESRDAEDREFVIRAAKEAIAAQETPEQAAAREKAKKKHAAIRSVHGASVDDGVGAGVGRGDGVQAADDFAAGWQERDEED